MNTTGYIYIRNHISYDIENACKLGITKNIPERDDQYVTGELRRGFFSSVYEIPKNKLLSLEKLLHHEFSKLHIFYNGGTEFFDKKIIILVEPFLINLGINYKKLTKEEIESLIRKYRLKKSFQKIDKKRLLNILKQQDNEIVYKPRDYQTPIIEKATSHYKNNNNGLLVLTCGTGKTLISLWVTQKLNLNTILVGVPNKLLLKQWQEATKVIFKNIPCLIVSEGKEINQIENFLQKNRIKCIIITTYSSSYKINKAITNIGFIFDMKILDEAHHLTTTNINIEDTSKNYIQILKVKTKKQLSLTATIKEIDNIENNKNVISNNDTNYFGEIIYKKCVKEAIEENIITDYVIQTIVTNNEKIEQLELFNIENENDKKLLLSAYCSLKNIFTNVSHHLLIYSNNKENCMKIVKFIENLLDNKHFNIPEIYYSEYHSELSIIKQKEILDNFEKTKFGIISCVYCLGEGWDFPLLDGVVFAENMTSNIRIVQSSLRASRKNKEEPNKITKIILPILYKDGWLNDSNNNDFKKIKEVIYQIGLEDENVIQKIKAYNIDVNKNSSKGFYSVNDIVNYDNELTQEIRLKTIKRTSLCITYEKAKSIIKNNFVKTKEEYYKLCDVIITLPKEPIVFFGSKFIDWIDYLDVEKNYYILEECRNKINKYLISYPELKNHYLNLTYVVKELCKLDNLFPPCDLWTDYYNISDLNQIINIKRKRLIKL